MIADRLWGWRHAFDDPVSLWLVGGIVAALVAAAAIGGALSAAGVVQSPLRRELWLRTASWAVLVPILVLPVLLGAFWTIVGIGLLSLACFGEYARVTGLFRERLICACVVLAIAVLTFAALDHWYNLFVAVFPLGVALVAIGSIPLDRPDGYIQRVALGGFGFLLFGCALGHLGYMANDWNYRPVVLLVLVAVALNDVFAFVVGKSLGGAKLLAGTSPNKTVSGALGALVLTTLLVTVIAEPVFRGSALADLPHRVLLGVLIGIFGQLGDLVLSSIKRDLGIKDSGALIPGHGGVLDRFNSLLLVAPAAFHYIGYFQGFGLDQPTRIITGG
jgi:phosphatidate cytidylyltransferase